MFDKGKAAAKAMKIQRQLKKETVEVETGDGAVKVKISGDQKIKKITLDEDKINFEDIAKLEKWIESAINQAVTKSQQIMMRKMKDMGGGLNIPGL